MNKRIGIFRGTFDPVHAGHVLFALTAVKIARLDHLYFVVEPNPLHKTRVTNLAKRSELLEQAV